jgi:hypothetical protein
MSSRRLALTIASFAMFAAGCHKCHTCCGIGGPCGQWNTAGFHGASSHSSTVIHEGPATMAPPTSTEHAPAPAPARPR